MKRPAPILIVLCLLAVTSSLSALGDPEAGEYQPAEGLENWDHSIDISGYEEGKYNLIIRGADAAGNLRYEGPYNVYVDPASDLPRLRISNPAPGMRVGGSLNVVGACLDDDEVERVEVRLDGGDPRIAEGAEFWSLSVDMDGLADGEHTIEAWGTDINGNSSEPQSVRFRLDRRAPAVQITSHPSGALVSGRVLLEGTVADSNGVEELGYSRQRDGAYQALKLFYDKSEDRYEYELRIETGELEDGPQVFWFRAEDATGSAAYMAFLLFVNNEQPLLQILSPQEGDTVHGRVRVVGKAHDRIGLRSLSYDAGGGESGQVQLVPGNPFWTQEFDLSGRKAGALEIKFTLENLTGNLSSEDLKIRLDPEGDKPVVEITRPRDADQVSDGFTVIGYIRDDDGGGSVEYAVDGADPVSVSASDAFRFTVSGLEPGRHTLGVRAVDVDGAVGEETEIQFTVIPPSPRVTPGSVRIGEGVEEYRPGIVVPAGQKASLAGEIRGSSISAQYSLQGGDLGRLSLKKSGDPNVQLFEIPLGKELSSGRVDVQVSAADEYGGSADFTGFVFLESAPASGTEILFADARIAEEGGILLAEGQPLLGYVPGGGIESVVLEPPTELVAAGGEGELVRVEAAAPGVSEAVRLKVSTRDGRTLLSDPLRFVTDLEAPTISVDEPTVGGWVKDSLVIAGSVQDASGVESLQYALGEGASFAALEMTAAEGRMSFSAPVPVGFAVDGPAVLILKATDAAGNTAEERIPLLRDGSAPVLSLVAPGPEDELNGRISLVGRVEDWGPITRIEFLDGEEVGAEIGSGREFRYDLNLSQYEILPERFTLKAVDAAGNQGLLVPRLNINPETDKPVVEIQVPGAAEVIKNDFIISGMVFDDDQVGRIFYSLDDEEYRELPGGNNFSIPVSIENIGDNEHVVSVRAEDIGGVSSEVASSTFMVSTSEPSSSLIEPAMSRHLRGVIDLAGESDDPNGIAAVYVSLDNGHSYQLAEGAEQWRYRLDSRLLDDGTHALLVKAVDNTATAGLFTTTINVDNGAPRIVLDTPSDGDVFSRTIPLDGRAIDDIGLAELTARLIPAAPSAELDPGGVGVALRTDGMILENLDIETLPPGWYNLSVEAADAAGNRSHLSRNIVVKDVVDAQRVDLMFPAPGAQTAGVFSVSGRVVSEAPAAVVVVLLDGVAVDTTGVDPKGYFSLTLGPEKLREGAHTLQAQAQFPGGSQLISEQRLLDYARTGPWVQVTSHPAGSFVTGRPYLEGQAGYYEEQIESEDEQPAGSRRRERSGNAVEKVEVSFDNGGSFERAGGQEQWRFRLETEEFGNGPLRILVKATFADGQAAVTHTQLQVDTRAPELALLSPEEGGRFNQEIRLRGTATDETGLESVEISLREGDKSRYGVPTFIQGLYLDVHAMGATYADLGLGLTFFDDNVKLQVQAGMSPPGRFSGFVMGAKLLANIATVPFGYFLGPSWEFFSMSLALGANISYFTMSGDSLAFTDEGLVLAAVVGQLEFARFEIADWRFFNTYSLYSELQLWFISSDVEAGTLARISFGFRIGLF